MRRAIVQYASDDKYREMLALTRDVHTAYCKRHNVELIHADGLPKRMPIWWRKVELLTEHIEHFDQVLWVDADCIIVASDFDVFDASRFGIAVCECLDNPKLERHLQCGVVMVSRSEQVKQFLKIWGECPTEGLPHPHWGDNAAFIHLMAIGKPHRDLLTILPNRFNHEAGYMNARPPIYIEAFHGLPDKLGLMRKMLADGPR